MTNETNAAEPSGASAGSHGEPVAWAVVFQYPGTGFQAVDGFFTSEEKARQACDRRNEISKSDATVMPLYRTPQPHASADEGTERGGCTLTADERAVIRRAMYCVDHYDRSILGLLLERTK